MLTLIFPPLSLNKSKSLVVGFSKIFTKYPLSLSFKIENELTFSELKFK